MPKTVTSSVKTFAGTVILREPLMMVESVALGKAISAAQVIRENVEAKEHRQISADEWQALYVPALCMCIEKAELINFPEHPTPESWPFTPKRASVQLTTFLVREVQTIYFGEQEEADPNA